jgi:hypothetical protein
VAQRHDRKGDEDRRDEVEEHRNPGEGEPDQDRDDVADEARRERIVERLNLLLGNVRLQETPVVRRVPPEEVERERGQEEHDPVEDGGDSGLLLVSRNAARSFVGNGRNETKKIARR